MDRRKFLLCCVGCVSLSAFPALKIIQHNKEVSAMHSFEKYWDSSWINIIDFPIVSNCNLKCKYCHHFAPIAKEEFCSVSQFEKDIVRLSQITNKKVITISLLGGETLLHPNLNTLIKIARTNFPHSIIDILTNGLLLDSMDENFWETASKYQVHISPSIYNVDVNWKSIYNKAKKYNALITYDGTNVALPYSKTKQKTSSFKKMRLNPLGNEPRKENCKMAVPSIINGKLYPCFLPALVKHVNNRFGTNFITNEKDYVDIHKKIDISYIKQKIEEKTNIQFCRYCHMPETYASWEHGEIHTIDEWVQT